MLEDIHENCVYRSESGFLFKVLMKGWHGQDCSEPMVCYTNLEPTADKPAFTTWMMPESILLKRFSLVEKWQFPEIRHPVVGAYHVWHGLCFAYTLKGWTLLSGLLPHQLPTAARPIR